MKYNYICIKQKLWHKDIGHYTSYAVALGDKCNIVQDDVCCEKEAAERLVAILNEFQIEPTQVKYIVEDEVYAGGEVRA